MGIERVEPSINFLPRNVSESNVSKSAFTNHYFAEQLQTTEVSLDSRLRHISQKEQIRPSERIAFITGVAGQDGSYLAEYLLSLGYTVYGCDLLGSESENIKHLKGKLKWSPTCSRTWYQLT